MSGLTLNNAKTLAGTDDLENVSLTHFRKIQKNHLRWSLSLGKPI